MYPSMMGFYIILESERSLGQIGEKLGTACPCAVHYYPFQPLGEAAEILAEGNAHASTLRVALPSYVEKEVRQLVADHFDGRPVRVYDLVYGDPAFWRELAPLVLDDPLVWVVDEGGVERGTDYLARLRGT